MQTLRQASILFLCAVFSTLCSAQLETRARSGLDARVLGEAVPLPLEQAFPFYVSETGPNQLRVTWTLAPGHYLYRHAFHFNLQASTRGSDQAVSVQLEDGLRKTDQFFGDIEAYYGQVSVDLTLPSNPGQNAVLVIQYQGCADWGFCYPPQRREFPLQP